MRLALLAVALLASFTSTKPAHAADTSLLWPRPTMTSPQTITLPWSGNVVLNLDNATDYIIDYPGVRRQGGLTVRGGRNIEIIGGASTITQAQSGARNLLIQDTPGVQAGRVVQIEGLDIDASGGGESDGIDIAAPSAVVQIEHVRVTGLIGHLASTHADVIQTFGGFKTLRIYMMTGASHYNDLYLRRENSPLGAPIGKVVLDHVNMGGYTNPSWWDIPHTIRALSIGTQPADTECGAGGCGPADSESATNCDLTAPVYLRDFYGDPPGTYPLARFMWPTDYMTAAGCPSALDAAGNAYWPSLDVSGVMRLGPPPGGDYAPAGTVGVNYAGAP